MDTYSYQRVLELEKALKQCVEVLKFWHGDDAFDLYFNHSPEMALIREALKALIERESARRLGRLGGSEPDLQKPPRRRSKRT